MTTFTSSLPESTLEKLSLMAKELNVPKNKIIQKALDVYLVELDKALMRKSLAAYKDDEDLITIAEEGMVDYANQLDLADETR